MNDKELTVLLDLLEPFLLETRKHCMTREEVIAFVESACEKGEREE